MSMEARHQAIDVHGEEVKAEIRAMAQRAITEINNKIGFYNRSSAQVRRYEKAKKEKAK